MHNGRVECCPLVSHVECAPRAVLRLEKKDAARPTNVRKTMGPMDGPNEHRTLHHRLLGSASPVLTATGFVNGKRQFSTPHRINTPQPITKNFVTGDYVGDCYGCAKLGACPSSGASGHMGEI